MCQCNTFSFPHRHILTFGQNSRPVTLRRPRRTSDGIFHRWGFPHKHPVFNWRRHIPMCAVTPNTVALSDRIFHIQGVYCTEPLKGQALFIHEWASMRLRETFKRFNIPSAGQHPPYSNTTGGGGVTKWLVHMPCDLRVQVYVRWLHDGTQIYILQTCKMKLLNPPRNKLFKRLKVLRECFELIHK